MLVYSPNVPAAGNPPAPSKAFHGCGAGGGATRADCLLSPAPAAGSPGAVPHSGTASAKASRNCQKLHSTTACGWLEPTALLVPASSSPGRVATRRPRKTYSGDSSGMCLSLSPAEDAARTSTTSEHVGGGAWVQPSAPPENCSGEHGSLVSCSLQAPMPGWLLWEGCAETVAAVADEPSCWYLHVSPNSLFMSRSGCSCVDGGRVGTPLSTEGASTPRQPLHLPSPLRPTPASECTPRAASLGARRGSSTDLDLMPGDPGSGGGTPVPLVTAGATVLLGTWLGHELADKSGCASS